MNAIKNYQILEQIYESDNSLVYRGILKPDNQPIILKILKENYPNSSELNRYKQEYEITRSINADGIIKAYSLERYQNSLVMFLEDFGGSSLKILISERQFILEEFLTIALKITESLAAIHNANIIHKDINPSNIVYNPKTGQLKIIDFGISTRLSRENQTIRNLNQIEGTLAYIAPEQTGRMNRGIDYRTDFYSLGVTFYQLLTNQLPFATTDPMELVYCHIAQQPDAPHKRIPSIPLMVSNIVMKLLVKIQEERYQSVRGLKVDLENCLSQLQTSGKIQDFSLGSEDISDKFHISEKLYGRHQEANQLLNTFDRVSQGTTEMMLVSGYSGIGKSALVNEIQRPILHQHGNFISGKFDQLRRNIPYSAISQAFQSLIRQILSESESALQTWKEEILTALGTNGQVIIDIIPEVEQIIGKQPLVEHIEATQAQNRFNLLFQRFISVFSKKEHPLVIFLDDLQWADLSSLKLLEVLMSAPENLTLLIIGAYRDNEVSVTHPLIQTIEQIKKAGTPVNHIELKPLEIKDINELIANTIKSSESKSKPLAELLTAKTQGNPFFLTQLLQSLYQEKLLIFDKNIGCWQWNLEQIQKIQITDNVIDLMINKIAKLDSQTQKVIRLAACIGNQFNLDFLSIVNNKSQALTSQELHPAVQEGLIVPLNNNYKMPLLWNQDEIAGDSSKIADAFIPKYPELIPYKFLHDRLQQAAYSLIPEAERKKVHLQIGYLLLENFTEHQIKENIFKIVNQLNEGTELITKQLQRNEIAKLNLEAGKRAKASTAYEASLRYLETGLKLLGKNSWKSHYRLTLELYTETIEALYLNVKYEQAEELSVIVLQQAKTVLDKVRIYQTKILLHNAKLQEEIAIDIAVKALAELGLNIAQHPNEILNKIIEEQEFLKSFLKKTSVQALLNHPQMTDPYKLAAMSILQQIMTSTIVTNFLLYLEAVLIQVNLCIQYGNSPYAPSPYSLYGTFICKGMKRLNIDRNIQLGYQFGQLSINLVEKFNLIKLKALVMHDYYGFIWHWNHLIRDTTAQENLLDAFQTGIDVGDYEYAFFACVSYCLIRFFGGYPLEEVENNFTNFIQLMEKVKQEHSTFYAKKCRQMIINFINNSLDIDNTVEQNNDFVNLNTWLLFINHFTNLINFYIFKDFKLAYQHGIKAGEYVENISSHITLPHYIFYSSLALLAGYKNSSKRQQISAIKQVKINQNYLKKWAKECLENFQHKYALVEAEKARSLGQNWQAEELYEQAIQGAKKYQFIHEEAIAYERAGEFYLVTGREEIGQFYLKNAHYCYVQWGAIAKVKNLEAEYPHLLVNINSPTDNKISTTISTSNNDSKKLDLITVVKASQTIASEITIEKLLKKLMKICIENAGAQKGFLILEKAGNWVIEAEGAMDDDNVTVLQSIAIDTLDTVRHLPLVPTAIVNYVAHSQENVVLDDAEHEGQFITDSYITVVQPKSILCIPLLHQGKLSGILYLENNLITHAFTPERIEILKILSGQAAISIENSRLYEQLEDYNRTLEQKVEERNQELLKTLEELKITQEKLRFENDLLKSSEQLSSYDYQIGGSLPMDAPTYVVRSADRHFYQALRHSNFCYILNARQMGKSSLMVRMMHHLQQEGFSCTAIDLTRIGSDNITPAQWYLGLAVELWQSFDLLDKVNLPVWWNEYKDLSPNQKLSQFIENILLKQIQSEKIYIFVDEIDSVLGLNFSVNDFFALVRFCYNQRSINVEYRRLTFAFFGVATPSDLISDHKRTPFNIGQSIQLEGFKEDEVYPLGEGLKEKVSDAIAIRKVIREVLHWTNGQPFLTQKLCKLIRNSSSVILANAEAEWIENLVQTNVIENWESQDEPEHLRTIRDRILNSDLQVNQLLELYRQILHQGELLSVDSPEEKELLLSGLIIKQQGSLKVQNRIYQLIFNGDWIERHIS
ncbi:MAG: AAA family ATPase [Nostoc sp. ChiSLP02]|nr:AAA family ATPase [Nostoc sp. DedSLP05]MDZ8103366.1 AAA family ATPase [Nostoc sp. DedSLP01]MDZ8189401.1 AAA family ATPase [Nostoc sp. ChiSLP02]